MDAGRPRRVWFGVACKGAPRVLVVDFVSKSFYFSKKGLVKEFFGFNDILDAQTLHEQEHPLLRVFIRNFASNFVDVECQSEDTTRELQRILREVVCDKDYVELFDSEPLLEGMLDKKGQVKWAPRFCSLARQKLVNSTGKRRAVFTVFKNVNLVPVNIIEVDVRAFSVSGEEQPGHHTFRITSCFRAFELRGANPSERNKWVATLTPFSRSAPEASPLVVVDSMPVTLHKYPVFFVELHAILMDPNVDLKTYYDHHDRKRVGTVLLQRMEGLVERRARAVSAVRQPSNMESMEPDSDIAERRSQLDLGSLLVQIERRSGAPRVSSNYASSVRESQQAFKEENAEAWTTNWTKALDNIAGSISAVPVAGRKDSMRILASCSSPKAKLGVTLGTRGAPVTQNVRSPSAFGRMVSRLQTTEADMRHGERDSGMREARNDLALVTRGSLFTVECVGKSAEEETTLRRYVLFVDQVDSCLVYGKAEELPSQRELGLWKDSGRYEFIDLSDIESITAKGSCSFAISHKSASLLLTAPAPGVCAAWQASLGRLVELAKTAEASDAPTISFTLA